MSRIVHNSYILDISVRYMCQIFVQLVFLVFINIMFNFLLWTEAVHEGRPWVPITTPLLRQQDCSRPARREYAANCSRTAHGPFNINMWWAAHALLTNRSMWVYGEQAGSHLYKYARCAYLGISCSIIVCYLTIWS